MQDHTPSETPLGEDDIPLRSSSGRRIPRRGIDRSGYGLMSLSSEQLAQLNQLKIEQHLIDNPAPPPPLPLPSSSPSSSSTPSSPTPSPRGPSSSNPSSTSSPSSSSPRGALTSSRSLLSDCAASRDGFSALVTIERACDVKAADANGLSDPYALLHLLPALDAAAEPLALLGRTPVHYETRDPVWNFPVFVPCLSLDRAFLRLEVWDYDHRGKDDFLGMALLSLAALACPDPAAPPSFAPVPSLAVPLLPRPPRRGLLRTKLDAGVSGAATLSVKFGPPHTEARSSASVIAQKRMAIKSSLKSTFAAGVYLSHFSAHAVPPALESHFLASSADSRQLSPFELFGSAPTEDFPSATYMFSLKMTFHAASNLKVIKNSNPYLLAYLVPNASLKTHSASLSTSSSSPLLNHHLNNNHNHHNNNNSQHDEHDHSSSSSSSSISSSSSSSLPDLHSHRVLIYRSAVFSKSLNPVWESSFVLPVVRSTDGIMWEIKSWVRGAGDPFLGLGSLHFPPVPPIPAQARIHVPLRASPSDPRAEVRGAVLLSYETAEPVLDRTHVAHDLFAQDGGEQEDYEALPDYALHRRNHGVSIPNFRDIGGWPVRWADRRQQQHPQGQRRGSESIQHQQHQNQQHQQHQNQNQQQQHQVRTGRMKERLIFRTSGISRATEIDAQVILSDLRIKTLIDLRTPDFAGNRGPFLTSFFDVLQPVSKGHLLRKQKKKKGGGVEYSVSSQSITVFERDQLDTILASQAQKSGAQGGGGEADPAAALENLPFDFSAEDAACAQAKIPWGHLYLCSLVGRKFKMATIQKSKKRTLLTAGLLAKTPQEQRRIICGPIFDRPDGLTVLYEMLIEHSKSEFLQLFSLFLTLSEDEYPVAYFCNHGKDRTGLTTAFLQSICGVDREVIVANYMISDHLLRPLKSVVDYEMVDGGLTPDIMSRTPAITMRSTFEYLDRKYQGVEAYLDSIGFSYTDQETLRSRLVIWD